MISCFLHKVYARKRKRSQCTKQVIEKETDHFNSLHAGHFNFLHTGHFCLLGIFHTFGAIC